MTNKKLISFDLKADFGFFKKPDINDGLYLTYNMLHKPALLGIIGAIAGLQGYQKNGELPEYYCKLKNLKVGIEPLNSDKGNYTKDIVKYNNAVGYANCDAGILNPQEQFLIKPAYRCYLLLNIDDEIENKLYQNLESNKAEFLPYMGKNDFSAWWDDFKDYNYSSFDFSSDYNISSIFAKTEAVRGYVAKNMSMFAASTEPTWLYFEKLPIGFNEDLYQYDYADFVYSNAKFLKEMNMSEAGFFYKIEKNKIIQLF
ncbi:MAG: type I-B CRISPR-associated protein Cas5 [Bacteroidia bacterium]|nr:type I-B CRISPR-associated protein Cas5 [Bacteroidia bacterium]